MAKELSDELINDWQMLMSGFKQVAGKFSNWKVRVARNKHIKINEDWDIICGFINFKYIEVTLTHKKDVIMTLRHLESYGTTIGIVLEYINTVEFKKRTEKRTGK